MYVKGTPDIEITYKYNEEGIRVEKSIKNLSNNQVTSTTYKVQGNKVIEETTGSNNIHYYYDINNSLIGFKYNNKNYYYEKSILNDIIGIVNEEGTTVVKYEYDAYGNITNIEDTSGINLSTINSYKYKDYYYDTESSYYYLNSRYYNPEVRRFINADGFVSTGTGILGNNAYAYTDNNPINRKDNSGFFWDTATDIAGVSYTYSVYFKKPTWKNLRSVFADVVLSVAPGVPNIGSLKIASKTVKSTNKVSDISKVNKGWKVGDDITDVTKAGNIPSWSTTKQRYWKNEAYYNSKSYDAANITRIEKGKPPLALHENGKFYSMELHHMDPRRLGGSNSYDNLLPVTPWEHAAIDPYRRFIP